MATTAAEHDLIWFFNQSAAGMGMQSNFSSIYNAIMSSGASRSSMPDSMTESRLDSSTRSRAIQAILTAMPPQMSTVLYAAYQPKRYPPHLTAFFGERLVPLTVWGDTANAAFEADALHKHMDDGEWFAWLESVTIAAEYKRLGEIKAEARQLLDKALESYDLTSAQSCGSV